MTDIQHLLVGLSKPFPCSYLPEEEETLLVLQDNAGRNNIIYERLMENGFRRSGNDVYRPHCRLCSACESLRLAVNDVQLSKSQKRLINKGKRAGLRIIYSSTLPEHTYFLYQKYITQRHADGGMFPPQFSHFEGIVKCEWMPILYLLIYKETQLIGVAVTDVLPNSLSANYTFFDPEFDELALGKYAILQQILATKALGKHHLYLGYQIDSCDKMNYKTQFKPHQRLQGNQWFLYLK